jgi:homocysteine S-methyltransferase
MSRAAIGTRLFERTFLTFGGNETYLLFIQGFPLREFCAFEVVDQHEAWNRMEDALLRPIADAAAARGIGLLTDCFVWRASPDYVTRLGAPGVARVNERAVGRTRDFVERWRSSSEAARACPVIVAGDLGPRGDGYAVSGAVSVEAAYDYHAVQVEALARAGIDLLMPLTMTSVGETLGILRAAQHAALPALVSPTIETDGKLPDGTPLGDFVTAVDEATSSYAASFMVNCAHPSHLEPTLRAAADRGEPWLARLRGLRANASAKTHAELDNSTELDRGDPHALGQSLADLQSTYGLSILGGCCGTDAEHLRCIAAACR